MRAIEHQLDSGGRHGIENRLRGNEKLKDFTLLGEHVPDPRLDEYLDDLAARYPVIIPKEYWKNHFWILGATRSGKTGRGLHPMVAQRIRQSVGPVIIGDMKGDDAMFHGLREVAKKEGRSFKWFTTVPYFSSYLFSPWDQEALRNIQLYQFIQLNMNALNLWHGVDYGKSYFSAQSRAALMEALKFKPTVKNGRKSWKPSEETRSIRSFSQAYECVQAIKGHPEFGGAHQLLMVLRDLANITPLNFEHEGTPYPKAAIDNAIKISDLLKKDENGKYPVVYFFMRSGSELVGVPQIMKLFLYCLLTAQIQAQDFYKMSRTEVEPPDDIFIALDEWQQIADDSIRNLLETGAGYNLHFALANQDIDQLKRGDTDLVETVWEGCGSKLIFSSRSPELQDRLIKVSGEKTVHIASYEVSHQAYRAGQVDESNAVEISNGEFKGVNIVQQRAPRFDRNLLIETSNHPSRAIYIPPQGASGIDFGGYPIVVDCPFHITEDEFTRLNKKEPWPEPSEETIVAEDFGSGFGSAEKAKDKPKPPVPRKRTVEAKQPTNGKSGNGRKSTDGKSKS